MKVSGLQGLGELRRTLRTQRERAEQQAREEAERQAQLDRERRLFALAVGPVTPLRPHRRFVPRALPLPPEPRQREADEAEVLRQALSDGFDVDTLLETDEELSYRRAGIPASVLNRLRRGRWSLQAQLDLHGLRRDEARLAVAEFLHLCQVRGQRCVRIVHGKGHGSPGREGILRVKVRRWLVQHDAVLAFVQARSDEGGAGALVVLLAGT
ncbi:MAG: Smr/MutS family protein [Inhella sp.]